VAARRRAASTVQRTCSTNPRGGTSGPLGAAGSGRASVSPDAGSPGEPVGNALSPPVVFWIRAHLRRVDRARR
jgi:hypothetical protein